MLLPLLAAWLALLTSFSLRCGGYSQGWQRSIKRGEHTLVRQDAYQLCVVLPGLMEGDELEAAKFMDDIDLRPSPTS